MENRAYALMAGLFTVIFLLAAAAAIWWLGDTRELTYRYILETRGSVTGLNLEAQVRYRGIRAGKVDDIRPDPRDPATLLVEISLGRQYRLTSNTVAKLNYQGITGLAYVMLEEGEGGAGQPLEAGGSEPPRLRIQPGLIERLGSKAGDIAGQVAELSVRLNRLLDERNLNNLAQSLDNLAVASEGLKELPPLVADIRRALASVDLGRLDKLLVHLEKTAGETAPLTAETRALVGTLHTLALRFDSLTATAGGVGERLNAETLPRTDALIRELTAASRRLDRLLDTLNETPQAMLFGPAPPRPGPGEPGFAVQPLRE